MDPQISKENTPREIREDADDSVQRQFSADDSPVEEAIYAVAALKGVEPTELEPLYNVIDPDAVDELFEEPGDVDEHPVVLMFTMAECRVILQSDRTLSVSHTEAAN